MAGLSRNPQEEHKKSSNFNIGMIIFFIIVFYVVIMILRSIIKEPISYVEVESGRITDSSTFTGIVLRDETVINANASGYINYYINDGEKVAMNENVCMIDTLGTYTQDIVENGNIQFTEKDYKDIEEIISLYRNSYSDSRFSETYTFKHDLQNKITEIISNQAINQANASGVTLLNQIIAPSSGIISYSYDGYENMKPEDIKDNMFNYAAYSSNQLTSSEKIEANSPAFKLTKSNDWSVIIKLNQAQSEILSQEAVIKVKFPKDNISTWAYVSVFNNGESDYAKLDMTRYMIRYITDRYLDVELVTAEADGLKIPTSSIVYKDFYTIPVEYLITDPLSNDTGFYNYQYKEDGELTMNFVKPIVYQVKNGLCYVDINAFSLGDYIGDGVSHDNLYRIGATDTVYGVFNINQGYTVFRIINILYRNDDYCIIADNTSYGVSLYDHIVLNASAVDEEEIIY